MDKKSFAIGVTERSKRVFDKVLFGKKQYKQLTYNSNCEWVTVLATIYADGSHLPLGVIFLAAGTDVQSS